MAIESQNKQQGEPVEEYALICGMPSKDDRKFYQYPIPKMTDLWSWLATFANDPNITILEIGSREVINHCKAKQALPLARYIGFDFHEGPNVDLVGDAHKLSDYISTESVDVIISFAVFEHLAMPWVVAEELSKVLKVNGVACIYTVFSFSEHELPWNFFQFHKKGLEALFNKSLGFEIIESGMGMPMVGRYAFDNAPETVGKPLGGLYASSYVMVRKIRNAGDFSWRSALEDIYGQTEYPNHTGLSKSQQ